MKIGSLRTKRLCPRRMGGNPELVAAQGQLRKDLATAGFSSASPATIHNAWPPRVHRHAKNAPGPPISTTHDSRAATQAGPGLPTTPAGVPMYTNMTLAEKKRFIGLIGEDPAQIPDVETFEFGSLRWNQYASSLGVRYEYIISCNTEFIIFNTDFIILNKNIIVLNAKRCCLA